jgi:hypothetical protein
MNFHPENPDQPLPASIDEYSSWRYQPAFADGRPFSTIFDELWSVSSHLLELLPDPALSPLERIERLARVVPGSLALSAHRRTGRAKLLEIEQRLAELVPEQGLTTIERIDRLVALTTSFAPGEMRLVDRLELIGDFRVSDIGR